MPVLPIVDAEDRLVPQARNIVSAISTYPDDPDKRAEFLASVFVSEVLEESSDPAPVLVQLAASLDWLIPTLHRSPSADKVMDAAINSDASAWAAGEILLTMLAVSTHHPELDINVQMAVEVISEFQEEAGLA